MNTTVTATTKDIPLIIALAMQVWPQTYTPILGEEQVAYMLNRFYTPDALTAQMEQDGHQFLIGYNGGKPVSFASYSAFAPGQYKLHKLYVVKTLHGTGAGKYMMQHIIYTLRNNGAESLQLNVNIHNSPAIRFYKKAGFHHAYSEDIDIGNGYFMNDHVLRIDF